MLRTASLRVSGEGIFVGKSLHEHLEIVLEHFNSVVIAPARRFIKLLEVSFNHRAIVIHLKVSTSQREQIIALSVIVSDDSSLPFFLWLFKL